MKSLSFSVDANRGRRSPESYHSAAALPNRFTSLRSVFLSSYTAPNSHGSHRHLITARWIDPVEPSGRSLTGPRSCQSVQGRIVAVEPARACQVALSGSKRSSTVPRHVLFPGHGEHAHQTPR
jgi:hypothetical protein